LTSAKRLPMLVQGAKGPGHLASEQLLQGVGEEHITPLDAVRSALGQQAARSCPPAAGLRQNASGPPGSHHRVGVPRDVHAPAARGFLRRCRPGERRSRSARCRRGRELGPLRARRQTARRPTPAVRTYAATRDYCRPSSEPLSCACSSTGTG
jgi:hypothetical protein